MLGCFEFGTELTMQQDHQIGHRRWDWIEGMYFPVIAWIPPNHLGHPRLCGQYCLSCVCFVTNPQTDITERKLNEETQKQRVVEAEQRRVEAEEAKRQQELLIDITSYVHYSSFPAQN